MKYEIGQKVETPLGVGTVVKVYKKCPGLTDHTHLIRFDVDEKHIYAIGFNEGLLKPYKTAHEKLLAMGWEEKLHDKAVEEEVKEGIYKQYVSYPYVILIDLELKEFTSYVLYTGSSDVDDVSWINLELSRILTQYLEEMEE